MCNQDARKLVAAAIQVLHVKINCGTTIVQSSRADALQATTRKDTAKRLVISVALPVTTPVRINWEEEDVGGWDEDVVEVDMCNKIARRLVSVVNQHAFN